MPFWILNYHMVWATKNREPLIGDVTEQVLRRSFGETCKAMDLVLHAVGFMPNHVHLLMSVPPTNAISEVIRRLKGGSSFAVGNSVDVPDSFRWQREYGVIVVPNQGMNVVRGYVLNQKQRHRDNDLIKTLERTTADTP